MLAQAHPIEATDNGPRTRGPARLCAATRRVQPVGDMIRFVAGPDGVVPDLKRKLPGRGVWITARRQTIAEAVKRGAFKRSLRADVKVPADLPDLVARLLVRSALDALSIACKAGQVVLGFAKVEAAIAAQPIVGVLHADGAGADGLRKIAAAIARRCSGDAQKVALIHAFTPSELDLALARPNVVHAALLAGRASETFLARWRDLERFRMSDPDPRDPERELGPWNEDEGQPKPAAVTLRSE